MAQIPNCSRADKSAEGEQWNQETDLLRSQSPNREVDCDDGDGASGETTRARAQDGEWNGDQPREM